MRAQAPEAPRWGHVPTTAGRAGKTLDQELARVVRDHAAPVGTKQAAGRPVRPVRRMDT